MAIDIAKKTIGGMSFELAQLPAWTALTAFQRFLTIAGPMLPTLAVVFKTMKGKKLAELSDVEQGELLEAITKGLPEALSRAAPGEVRELAMVLLEPCTVRTGKETQRLVDVADALLVGKLPVLLQLIGWAVQVHFGSFFSGLGGGAAPSTPAPAA